MSKSEADKLGGKATYEKHGSAHMTRIGKLGAKTTWTKYQLVPAGTSQYAMINRTTKEIIAII